MEQMSELLYNVLFLSINPFAWAMAVRFSKNSGGLRKPVIAAVMTQMVICCLLTTMVVWSNIALPVGDMVTILLIPCVLSGMLISAIVILFTKRPRLRQLFSSQPVEQFTYTST